MDIGSMGTMMSAMGLVWTLGLLVLLLIAAAAIKYLFFDRTRRDRRSRDSQPPG